MLDWIYPLLLLLVIVVTHCYPFFFQDRPHCGESPLVYWTVNMLMGHGVRHGVDLELEADFDDIEGGDAESMGIVRLASALQSSCLDGWEVIP